MMSHRSLFAVGGAFLLAAACGAPEDDDDDGEASGASGVNGLGGNANVPITTNSGNAVSGTSSGVVGGSVVGGVGGTGADGCEPAPDDQGCVGVAYEGENIPLDIFIMFDQSCSMSCPISQGGPGQCCMGGPNPRIDPVRQAVDQFLRDPASAGIGVGISFFGYFPVGQTSCNPQDYSQAAVGIAPLPGNADAVLGALHAVLPTGETPTDMAIEGACNYLTQFHQTRPQSKKVILLVTDGVPETPQSGCDPSVQGASQEAENCLNGDPNIETYVLGVGQALDSLNAIAAAGGTEQAYLVDSGDVANSVLVALNAIRADAAIPCTLPVPQPTDGTVLNYELVNLGICDAGGQTVSTAYVGTPDLCSAPGHWYYEASGTGQTIQLCEATCETVTAAGAKLFFNVGCTRNDIPAIE